MFCNHTFSESGNPIWVQNFSDSDFTSSPSRPKFQWLTQKFSRVVGGFVNVLDPPATQTNLSVSWQIKIQAATNASQHRKVFLFAVGNGTPVPTNGMGKQWTLQILDTSCARYFISRISCQWEKDVFCDLQQNGLEFYSASAEVWEYLQFGQYLMLNEAFWGNWTVINVDSDIQWGEQVIICLIKWLNKTSTALWNLRDEIAQRFDTKVTTWLSKVCAG